MRQLALVALLAEWAAASWLWAGGLLDWGVLLVVEMILVVAWAEFWRDPRDNHARSCVQRGEIDGEWVE